MTEKLKKDIIAYGYEDKMSVDFQPFSIAYEIMDNYDIMTVCPHLKYRIPEFLKKHECHIPIYILPPRMYGSLEVEEVYEDVCDVIEGYKKDGRNPWCFEGEENTLKIKRRCSHRHFLEGRLE